MKVTKMVQEVKTPVGRIVWGNPGKPQVKKYQEGPEKGKHVLKDGQPINQWVFGIAIPKAEFENIVWPAMLAEASTGFPNGVPQNFAWKYKDGDGTDNNGKRFSDREGYTGCIVLTVSTESFGPTVFKYENNSYRQLAPNEFKTGDYIVVALNIVLNKATNPTRTSGLYINPQAIEFVAYGPEIVTSTNPDELFGASGQRQQYALPPGASLQPIAPSHAGMMPQQPGMMPQQPGMMPQQPGMMPQQPGMMPQQQPGFAPAHDFVQNAGQQQPQQQPGMMPGMMPNVYPNQGR